MRMIGLEASRNSDIFVVYIVASCDLIAMRAFSSHCANAKKERKKEISPCMLSPLTVLKQRQKQTNLSLSVCLSFSLSPSPPLSLSLSLVSELDILTFYKIMLMQLCKSCTTPCVCHKFEMHIYTHAHTKHKSYE